jgi:hypothetical protein
MVSKSFPVEIAKICRYRLILTIWVAFGKGMNVGQAMVRGGHGENLRGFAHPGLSITLLEMEHHFAHTLAARGNMPFYRNIVFGSKTKRPGSIR